MKFLVVSDIHGSYYYAKKFKEIYENTWSPVFIWHDMYLTCLSTTETCAEVLGTDVTKKLLNECVDKIIHQ